MTLSLRGILGIGIVALVAGIASADIRVLPALTEHARTSPARASTLSQGGGEIVRHVAEEKPVTVNPAPVRTPLTANDSVALPAAPRSTVLLLTGLVSLGSLQLGRSARRIHLGSLPQWFHSGAPERIGHVTLLYPDDIGRAPYCIFDLPTRDDPRPQLWRQRCLDTASPIPQRYHVGLDPTRGPPVLS